VAITFTRKAAREMRNRIRAELQRYLADSGLSQAERQSWDELYSLLDAARIVTLGFLISDRQTGPFRLEVRSIDLVGAAAR